MRIAVPVECSSWARGSSAAGSRCITAPTIRLPCSASWTSRTELGRPTARGITTCGRTTVPRRGRIPTTSGMLSSLSSRSPAMFLLSSLEQIHGLELTGCGANESLSGLLRAALARGLGPLLAEVGDEILDLLLHLDHPPSHL